MSRNYAERMKARRKQAHKEHNYAAVEPIYQRATQSAVDDYLASAVPSDPERITRILAQAAERRQRRNQRRLEQQP